MMLNKNQKIVILAALGIILLMGIFPPWVCGKYSPGSTSFQELVSEYHFLFVPPSTLINYWEGNELESSSFYRVDYGRLFLQWLLVIAVAGGLFFVFREAPEKKS